MTAIWNEHPSEACKVIWVIMLAQWLLKKNELSDITSPNITSWHIVGKQWKQWQTLFFWAPKSLQMVTAALKLKDTCSLKGEGNGNTHSSILAWRIPGTEEPGGLPSVGLHRVGHDWCDLAADCYYNKWSQTFKLMVYNNRNIFYHSSREQKFETSIAVLKSRHWEPPTEVLAENLVPISPSCWQPLVFLDL